MNNFNLDRFIEAQERDYSTALAEIKSGRKLHKRTPKFINKGKL